MKYKCDECLATFEDGEVVLKKFGNNFQLIGQMVLVKNNKTGKIFKTTTDKISEGDCGLHCPSCGRAHLFGFDRVIESSGVAV
jgi:hypothetical protein